VAAENKPTPNGQSRLWLWVVGAFLLQLAAWSTWLVIASRHKVAEVPVIRTP